jgi:hypothetical protein
VSAHDSDPGRGDVGEIERLARRRREKVDDLDLGRHHAVRCGEWAATSWQAESGRAFVAEAEAIVRELDVLLSTVDEHGAALEGYARELDDIRAAQAVLEQARSRAEEARDRSSATLVVLEAEAELQVDLPGVSTPADHRRLERSRLARELDDAVAELGAVGRRWAELVDRRHAADHRVMSALHGGGAVGALDDRADAARHVRSPEDALCVVSGTTPFELAALLDEVPLLAVLVGRASPEAVREWWESLAVGVAVDADGFSAVQLALLAGAPGLLGTLDGLPPGARVRANALSARRQIAENGRTIAEVLADPTRDGAMDGLVEALRRENEYLARAAALPPAVQLYTYDRAGDRIVEMIGDWDAPPERVYTYVPGTFSEMAVFWAVEGATQEVGDWLVENDGVDSVAFVYKDGRFPGGGGVVSPTETMGFAPGILEANDQRFARESGERLASFQRGLHADPLFSSASTSPTEVAVGHSWGLADVLASEVVGAQYDHVVSLAGAGAVDDWQPDPGTEYDSLRYWDTLGLAQATGGVYAGRNPQSMVVFEDHVFESDGDRALDWRSSVSERLDVMNDNHRLIASTDRENREALGRLRDELSSREVWPR